MVQHKKRKFFSIIRKIMPFLGGVLVAEGVFNPEDVEAVSAGVGSLLTLASVWWGVADKDQD